MIHSRGAITGTYSELLRFAPDNAPEESVSTYGVQGLSYCSRHSVQWGCYMEPAVFISFHARCFPLRSM